MTQGRLEAGHGGRAARPSPALEHLPRELDWQQDDHSAEHTDQCRHDVPRPLIVQRAAHHLLRRSVFLESAESQVEVLKSGNAECWKDGEAEPRWLTLIHFATG